jgi:hypothetical protein
MCWNAEVSLLTFLSSTIMCGYLWDRNDSLTNDRAIASWIFAFSFMQLFEFFMWRNIKDHSIVSKLSLIFILAQPLVLASALLLIGNTYPNPYVKYILYVFIIISTCKVLYSIYYAFILEGNQEWLSVKGPNCHLIWYFTKNENKMPYLARINDSYYYPLLLTCLLIQPQQLGFIYALFGFVSFNFSKLYYGLEYGSMWCWIANILGLFAIVSKPLMSLQI